MSLQTLQTADFLEEDPAPPAGESAADGGPALLALLVDELAHGVLVISARGRILHANLAARRELEQAQPRRAVGRWRGLFTGAGTAGPPGR